MNKIIDLSQFLVPATVTFLLKTLKIKIHNESGLHERAAFIFWHKSMLAGWWLFRNKKSAAIVSRSKDGEILNGVLTDWNYKVVRGSSTKGGKEALDEIISLVNENYSAVITPDGPLGPPENIKNGVLKISNRCGVPVIPVRIIYEKKKVLEKSWDKFEIPFPFTSCEVFIGKKYFYEKYLYDEELENLKRKISEEM